MYGIHKKISSTCRTAVFQFQSTFFLNKHPLFFFLEGIYFGLRQVDQKSVPACCHKCCTLNTLMYCKMATNIVLPTRNWPKRATKCEYSHMLVRYCHACHRSYCHARHRSSSTRSGCVDVPISNRRWVKVMFVFDWKKQMFFRPSFVPAQYLGNKTRCVVNKRHAFRGRLFRFDCLLHWAKRWG